MGQFDVIVIGGGHAGVEAAAASAHMGARTALVSFDLDAIGAMSCNPAIGGIGKGHLVREIDALDGILGRAADAGAIHYRMLNRSKGSAVWGPRVQADRVLFKASVQEQIDTLSNLELVQGEAASLEMTGGKVAGVCLADGTVLRSGRVVLCTGTFLGGILYRGEEKMVGGRVGENAAQALANQLREADLPMARLKTGTPPRLDGRTIDWAILEEQPSDGEGWTMSALAERCNPQVFCAITRTNAQTHALIAENLDRSPLFSGAVNAQGPRYCPSIEDKIHRFADRDGHQVFLEPEGLSTNLVYPNGISTSLPEDVQLAFLRSMKGLERVDMAVPGYAVEYDHIDPRALGHDLQLRAIPGLYCAGQINGTTGYEEAGAQGLVAGMHAAAASLEKEPASLDRSNSYIGVMIDDLVLQGVSEPYRMLTSRAEYRLRLRAGNAQTRLTPLGMRAGLVRGDRAAAFGARQDNRQRLGEMLQTIATEQEIGGTSPEKRTLAEWLATDRFDQAGLEALLPTDLSADPELVTEVIEDAAYAPYLARQEAELRDLRASENMMLPSDFPYGEVPGLSNEMVERLSRATPETLGDASRVAGVTPAALAAVMVHARKRERAAA